MDGLQPRDLDEGDALPGGHIRASSRSVCVTTRSCRRWKHERARWRPLGGKTICTRVQISAAQRPDLPSGQVRARLVGSLWPVPPAVRRRRQYRAEETRSPSLGEAGQPSVSSVRPTHRFHLPQRGQGRRTDLAHCNAATKNLISADVAPGPGRLQCCWSIGLKGTSRTNSRHPTQHQRSSC
jgi:hypothetical protein